MRLPSFILFLLVCAPQTNGIMYDYTDVKLPAQAVLVSTHGIYGAADGDSAFVSIDLDAVMILPVGQALTREENIHIALVEHSSKDIGDMYTCHDDGSLVLKQDASGKPLVHVIQDDDGHSMVDIKLYKHKTSFHISNRFAVTQDGLYSLLVARCMVSVAPQHYAIPPPRVSHMSFVQPPNYDGAHEILLNGKV